MNQGQLKNLDDSSESNSPLVSPKKNQGTPGGRQEHSLGVLTQKFLELLLSSEDKTIDLNEAVQVNFI